MLLLKGEWASVYKVLLGCSLLLLKGGAGKLILRYLLGLEFWVLSGREACADLSLYSPPASTSKVWHVEGMSHENIVATAELIVKKDPSLTGGGLQFQRSFRSTEGGAMIMGFPQDRPYDLDDVVEKPGRALGIFFISCAKPDFLNPKPVLKRLVWEGFCTGPT